MTLIEKPINAADWNGYFKCYECAAKYHCTLDNLYNRYDNFYRFNTITYKCEYCTSLNHMNSVVPYNVQKHFELIKNVHWNQIDTENSIWWNNFWYNAFTFAIGFVIPIGYYYYYHFIWRLF